MGFRPMLSEFNSFPVSPGSSNLENCIRNVEKNADIFVLIVGNRFGSIVDSEKSITNLEYLHAKSKGIPIYVFIDKKIIHWLPVWKKNATIAFPDIDSPKLLEFANELRSSGTWSYSFENGTDIVETLRKQWASLFSQTLALWRQARQRPIPTGLRSLEGEALRLVIERPDYWEYLLYCESLETKLSEHASARMDVELGINLGINANCVGLRDFMPWLGSKVSELQATTSSVNKLFSEESVLSAFGPLGISGDPVQIVYFADRLAKIYRDAINWTQSVRSVVTHEVFDTLKDQISEMPLLVLKDIDAYLAKFKSEIANLRSNPVAEGETRTITMLLELALDEDLVNRYTEEMERVVPIAVALISDENE